MITNVAIEEVENALTENGDRIGATYFGAQVIEAAREHLAHVEQHQQKPPELLRFYERSEDMGQGRLQLIMDGDADVIITVINSAGKSSSIEFCRSFSGGGRSPKTREALIALIHAIQEDNEKRPLPKP